MNRYLLTCECGNNVTVDVGQAGGHVACLCGKQLDVPPLRKLRHFPTAAPPSEAAPATWNARKGLIAVFLLLATVAAISATWMRVNEARIPPFDYDIRMFNVDKGIEELTPAQGWKMWTEVYRPLAERGFSIFGHRDAAEIELLGAQQRFTQKMLWTIAGICAAVALAAALWPRPAATPARKR